MADLTTIIAAVGLGVSVYGTAEQTEAANKANDARKKQAKLEASRRRREQVRQLSIARADALSSAVQGGAQFGSGVAGGQAAATSTAASNVAGINQGQAIGKQLYNANTAENTAKAVSSLGGTMFTNSDKIGNLFSG